MERVDRKSVYWSYSEDEERLEHESPEEALVEYFDNCVLLVDVPEAIKKEGPVKVYGWARKTVDWDTMQAAEYAVERENEDLAESYGDPDGDEDVISGDVRLTLIREIAEAFDRALANVEPWQCEVVESKTFSPEEVEVALRASCPEWFEDEGVRSGCTCRTGDGPGLHDDGCYMTLQKDQRDGTI